MYLLEQSRFVFTQRPTRIPSEHPESVKKALLVVCRTLELADSVPVTNSRSVPMPNFQIKLAVPVTQEAAISAGCMPLPQGFPFILDTQTGNVEHEPTAFLRRLCLSGGNAENMVVTPRTAMCRAVDLKDLLEYLRASKTEYVRVSADVLYRYAATMANQVSPYTQVKYSHLTIARRCWTAVEFCAWLADRLELPEPVREGINQLRRQREHTHRSQGYRSRTSVRPTLLRA
jgi:hypothetical protein